MQRKETGTRYQTEPRQVDEDGFFVLPAKSKTIHRHSFLYSGSLLHVGFANLINSQLVLFVPHLQQR
jgi:hypothetical protein